MGVGHALGLTGRTAGVADDEIVCGIYGGIGIDCNLLGEPVLIGTVTHQHVLEVRQFVAAPRIWVRTSMISSPFCDAVSNGVTPSQGDGSLAASPRTGQHNGRRARRHQDRRPHQHHPRALRHHAAGRPGRRRDQGRGAGGRRGAPYRQAGQDARHGPDLSLCKSQQALALPRPQEPGGARGAPESGRRRRCLRPCAAAAGHRGAGAGLRGDPQDQAGHRLCRRLRLFGRRSLRKTAGLRRCHPGPLRHRPPDGPGRGRRRATLSADHPGRQDGAA